MAKHEEQRPRDPIGRTFYDTIRQSPVSAANLLTTAFNDEQKLARYNQIICSRYNVSLSHYEESDPWLPDLLTKSLPLQFVPHTVVSLGSGGGFELLHLRKQFPKSDLIAIENDQSPITIESLVACVGLSNARLLYRDMNKVSADQLSVSASSFQNLLVVCRHPGPFDRDTDNNRKWFMNLGKWALEAVRRDGIMLITTFIPGEMEPIEFIMLTMGLPIKRTIYTFGNTALDYKRRALALFNKKTKLHNIPDLDWLDKILEQYGLQDVRMDAQVMTVSK